MTLSGRGALFLALHLQSYNNNNNNNNNRHVSVYGAIISWKNHRQSSSGSFDECTTAPGDRLTFEPSQSAWAAGPPMAAIVSTATIAIN